MLKVGRFPFSNFYMFQPYFKIQGQIYKTPEHLFQSRKTISLSDREQIAKAVSPAEAKKIGNQVQMRKDWNKIKVDVMTWVQELRFNQPYWRKQLIEYEDLHSLIEYNYWHDNFWGACTCDRCREKEKLNHLGKIIQQIKDKVKDHS